MARKQKSNVRKNDPLKSVEPYAPNATKGLETAVSNQPNNTVATTPISPLGSPITQQPAQPAPTSGILHEAHKRITQLQAELAHEQNTRRALEKKVIELETAVTFTQNVTEELTHERSSRHGLEREMAALEVEVKQVHDTAAALEAERNHRIELEKRLASLEVRAERAQEIATQLVEEQKIRVDLEREKATLDVQVQNMRKLDQLLSEERQARMNAQSRASSAEAQLARLEGERNQSQGSSNKSSFMNRLRGR
ncbi:MAG: DUF4686 domain-containing protein [Chloroflexi bacterium]|nr:DUF4686 domain-containing protein [Chloroflexota bacterium]